MESRTSWKNIRSNIQQKASECHQPEAILKAVPSYHANTAPPTIFSNIPIRLRATSPTPAASTVLWSQASTSITPERNSAITSDSPSIAQMAPDVFNRSVDRLPIRGHFQRMKSERFGNRNPSIEGTVGASSTMDARASWMTPANAVPKEVPDYDAAISFESEPFGVDGRSLNNQHSRKSTKEFFEGIKRKHLKLNNSHVVASDEFHDLNCTRPFGVDELTLIRNQADMLEREFENKSIISNMHDVFSIRQMLMSSKDAEREKDALRANDFLHTKIQVMAVELEAARHQNVLLQDRIAHLEVETERENRTKAIEFVTSEEFSNRVTTTIENELQCSVCSELFIKAVTLGCAHSFCDFCIYQWKKTKKDCPICRNPIKSIVSSLALDSFISQYILSLPKDVQDLRADSIKARKAFDDERRLTIWSGACRRTIPYQRSNR